MKNKFLYLILLFFSVLVIAGCGKEQVSEDTVILNFISNDRTKLVTREYVQKADSEDITALVSEILYELQQLPEDMSYVAPLHGDFVVNSFEVKEGKIVLDMSGEYLDLDAATEVLTRAALVKTLVQLDGINYVSFKVNGSALRDAIGGLVGIMSADSFVDNEGSQINPFEETKIKLYFADETGTQLVEVTRTLTYNTNLSLERLVIEQLIAGPTEEVPDALATMNSDTGVLNVTVKDKICYVNLSGNFLTQPVAAIPEITIYSIVNSLAELPGVNKVQISVEGESSVMYHEEISLATPFEANRDLIKTE